MNEIERHADNILRAAGSGLRHYTMPATRQAILDATAEAMRASDELVALVIQYRDDLKYPPSRDSVERRVEAINDVLAKHRGQG